MAQILKRRRIKGYVYRATVKRIGFKEKSKTFYNLNHAQLNHDMVSNLNKNFSKMEPDINFYNKIRALDFPGFVPPYVKINGKKKYLFIKKNKKRKIFKKLKFKKNNYNIYFSKTY